MEFLLLGGFSIFIGFSIIRYWFDGGHGYMLPLGLAVVLMGVAMIGGAIHFYRRGKRG